MTDRKKPGVAFWVTVGLVSLLLIYPTSIGPACWITSRISTRGAWISTGYFPVIWVCENSTDFIFNSFGWDTLVGASREWCWEIDDTGHHSLFCPQSSKFPLTPPPRHSVEIKVQHCQIDHGLHG